MKKVYLAIALVICVCLLVHADEKKPLKQFFCTQITGGELKNLEDKDIVFLKSLSPDRLLYCFRERSGLPNPSGVSAYGGWEAPGCELRGHSLGHYLTALSLLYAQSGDGDALVRINKIVSVLRQTQTIEGTGYISAFSDDALDRVEYDGSGWAPYYTLHKLLQGLMDAYTLAGNEEALQAASDFATYIYNRTTALTDKAKWEHNLDVMEVGGFAESMLNVYMYTHDERHLEAGRFFQQMSKLLPSAEGKDILEDTRTYNFNHANATIPQFIAAEREYEITGDETLLRAAENFWTHVTLHRAYCNGSTGYHEHWNLPSDRLSQEVDGLAGESCCTNNMIKLSNDLFRFSHDAKYAEYVERATLNHIMSTINPDNGNFMYFHTQLPGSYKTYGRNTDVFWCCTGTGMENHVRYSQSVFFAGDDELYVCQYFPSALSWTEKGLKLEQVTEFPNEEHCVIMITEGTAAATLKLRIPSWCNGFSVKVNGEEAETDNGDGFCTIKRIWISGDRIDVTLPMHLYAESLKDKPRMTALFYGPYVLAGKLGTSGVTYNHVNVTNNYFDGYPENFRPSVPVPMLKGSIDNLDWIDKEDGKMVFHTASTSDNSDLTLIPLYQAVNMRFSDYWLMQGELEGTISYPEKKTKATPVTSLEDGEEYVIQNANAALSCRNLYWQGGDLRTRSSGNIDDVVLKARKVVSEGQTYWSFLVTSSSNRNMYLGRNNHANAQASNEETLWTVTYVDRGDSGESGFELLLKGDAPDGMHEMMINASGDWVVVWKGNPGSDYSANTSRWMFYRSADINPEQMAEYNAVRLSLYQYLTEAAQMYERGITSMASAYNNAVPVYNNPDNTVEDMNAAIALIRSAINTSVGLYAKGETATYGIINPSFENLSNQGDESVEGAVAKPAPFGWHLTKDGEEIDMPTWAWCSINGDGGAYKDGKYIWGVWNGGVYGNIELSQTLHGLQNGWWQLTARLMNNKAENGNLARIFANNASMLAGNESDYTLLPSDEECSFSSEWSARDNDMHMLMKVTTKVTDGTLSIGARSNGFFKVDDFRLTYLDTDEDAVESLDGIQMPDHGADAIYDLNGRRLFTTPSHGIYIQNHRKLLK